MKILIIDDDVDLLDMTARRIARKGAETFTAQNLTTATDLLHEHADLTAIICDLYLQDGENGLGFYEQNIKNSFKGKFVLATGDSSSDKRIAKYIVEDKLFSCVEKPYSIDNLLAVLNS